MQVQQITFVFFSWILSDSEFRKAKSLGRISKVRIQRGLLVAFVFSSWILCDSKFQKKKSLGRISKSEDTERPAGGLASLYLFILCSEM
jgi:hypothetical protein